MLRVLKNTTILATVSLITILMGIAWFMFAGQPAAAKAQFLKWDLVLTDVSTPGVVLVGPGGKASVSAGDLADEGPSITLTGSGTFVAPGGGRSNAVTGGGTWTTFDYAGIPTGNGTYEVTSLVSWIPTLGGLPSPPFIDNNGDIEDATAGLAVMTIEYSDGSTGVLTVSCQLPTTPPEIEETLHEGISVTKDVVHFWNRVDTTLGPDGDGITVFHYINNP